jgi:hypothetical protein
VVSDHFAGEGRRPGRTGSCPAGDEIPGGLALISRYRDKLPRIVVSVFSKLPFVVTSPSCLSLLQILHLDIRSDEPGTLRSLRQDTLECGYNLLEVIRMRGKLFGPFLNISLGEERMVIRKKYVAGEENFLAGWVLGGMGQEKITGQAKVAEAFLDRLD